jgi:ribosomal protein S27E
MKKPNLNTIIENNLDKTGHVRNVTKLGLPNKKQTMPFVSEDGYKQGLPPTGSHYRIPSDTLYNPTPYRIKATPNNGPSQWLEPYDTSNTQFPGADYVDEQHYQTGGGTYLSDRAQATQFGQYAEGGSSWMLTNPNKISTYFPRMNNGGGLLSRTVKCSNCGWSWKAVDGGKDVMTCHKCGDMIKMQNGGDPSIPDLQEGNWLNKYQTAGQVVPYQMPKPAAESTAHSFFNPMLGRQTNTPVKSVSSMLGYNTNNNKINNTVNKQQATISEDKHPHQEGFIDFMGHKFRQNQTPQTLAKKNTYYGDKISNTMKAVSAAGELVPNPVISYPSMAVNMALGVSNAADDYANAADKTKHPNGILNKDLGHVGLDLMGIAEGPIGLMAKPLHKLHSYAPAIIGAGKKAFQTVGKWADFTNNYRFHYKTGGQNDGWLDKHL